MDEIIRAVSKDGFAKISVVTARDAVQRANAIHHCSPTAIAALGRSLCAASMLGDLLKEENGTVTLRINGGGGLGTIVAVSDCDGNVRGMVANPAFDLPTRPDGKLDGGGAVGKAHAAEQLERLGLSLLLVHALDACGRSGQVVHHVHVVEEVELLEHHAHLLTVLVNVLALSLGADVHAVEEDLAGGRRLQQVQAAQKRRLTGPGRADDDHVFTGADVLGNVVEHEVVAERFGQMFNVDHFDAASFRARSAAWKTA